MRDAVSWLAETFAIGGINIESGDYGVCGCARCKKRRADREAAARRSSDTGESWSHADMADNLPRLFDAANARRDDLWLYSELQWDNLLDPQAHTVTAELPYGGIYQHTANRTYWGKLKKQLTRSYVAALPTQPNVLRCQFACQWNGDARTERYALNAQTFADMAIKAHGVGMDGLTVWGEPSPYHATVEISYLAFARFSYDPSLSWDQFLSDDVAPILGGADAAARFLSLAGEMEMHQTLPVAPRGAKAEMFGGGDRSYITSRRRRASLMSVRAIANSLGVSHAILPSGSTQPRARVRKITKKSGCTRHPL